MLYANKKYRTRNETAGALTAIPATRAPYRSRAAQSGFSSLHGHAAGERSIVQRKGAPVNLAGAATIRNVALNVTEIDGPEGTH